MARLRDELLIPFQGIGEAGRDLWEGSKVLAGHGCRALRRLIVVALGVLRRRDGAQDWADVVGGGVLIVVLGAPIVMGTGAAVVDLAVSCAPWIGGVFVVSWVVAAWTVAPPRTGHSSTNDQEEVAGEQDTPPDTREVADRMSRLVLTAVADAADAGLKGVHVAALRTMLADACLPALEDVEALHRWLKDSGFPVNRNVKVRGPNRLGVRADELTTVLGRPIRDALATLAGLPEQEPPHPPVPTPAGEPPSSPLRPTLLSLLDRDSTFPPAPPSDPH